ncbi:MAG: type I methionyl aminopeptidase [Candidatus Eremiobacteraeota bacterium]|nr:type I methionyl aminopeptidase [Candidatus Eremiobacteraeota bacterium]
MVILKSREEIEKMQASARIASRALSLAMKAVKEGIQTREIDREVERFIRQEGGIPAFKGYRGFPASVCISINEEVVHGIPGNRRIRNGDLVSLDLGAILDGYCSDTAATVAVGDVKPGWMDLCRVTRECLELAIDKMRVGNRLGDISNAVESHARAHGYSVVKALAGHGIGRDIHEEPEVPNYGPAGFGMKLEPGLVLAIEPMVNMGGFEVRLKNDNWTVVTADGMPSAHFEHTIALLEDGPLVLTRREDEMGG